MQKEITKPSDLLNEDGTLKQEGWARSLILRYNRENIAQAWHRIKEWDYYAVLTNDYGIALTFSDLGIMGLFSVVWLDFKAKTFISDEEIKLFTKGETDLPRTSEKGISKYEGKKIKMIFFVENNSKRILEVDFPSFNNGLGLEAKLELNQNPNQDTMVIATSWKENRKAFYYNQKINCMPADGYVKLGEKEYNFNKQGNAFGVLDWGRGVWTYKNRWFWGSASGILNGVPIGWNIGYGFSDRSPASENIILYHGKAHKIEDVEFIIPKENYLKKWKFKSSDGRFEMDFDPILDRNADINLLIFRSVQHQVFGYYTGDLILDDGTKLHVDQMLGFAEDVYNRW